MKPNKAPQREQFEAAISEDIKGSLESIVKSAPIIFISSVFLILSTIGLLVYNQYQYKQTHQTHQPAADAWGQGLGPIILIVFILVLIFVLVFLLKPINNTNKISTEFGKSLLNKSLDSLTKGFEHSNVFFSYYTLGVGLMAILTFYLLTT